MILILEVVFIILIIGLFSLANSKYRDELSTVNKEEYRLYRFLPIGFYVQDIHFLKGQSAKINSHIRDLYGKYEYSYRNRLYKAEKIALVFILITLTLFFGVASGINNRGTKAVLYLEKPQFGQGKKEVSYTYELSLENTVIQDNITVIIPEEKGSEEEIAAMFIQVADELPKLILGENDSLSHITSNLNLVESYKNSSIKITWESLDNNVLLSNGEIRGINIEEGGNSVALKVILSYYEQSIERVYDLMIYKPITSNEEKLEQAQEEISHQLSVEELEQEGQSQITLPVRLSDENISIQWLEGQSSTKPITIIIGGILLSVFLVFLKDYELKKSIEKRNNQMLLQFPEFVNKMTLLINAGMTVSRAFGKICSDYIHYRDTGGEMHPLYEEMLVTIEDMKKGVSEANAYEDFGKRCKLPELLRFTSVIVQNLKKGSNSLVAALRQQSQEAWQIREDLARKKGEKASTRLVVPMGIMLVAIIIIVLIPAVLSLKL